MTGLTLTGNGAANGYVIVGNSVGVGTWMPVGTLGATSAAGTNQQMQYNNAGSMGGASGLLTNGTNLGIGTFSNTLGLQISGNIGIGTFLAPAGGSNNLETTGNVGIGTYYIGGAGEGALSVMNGNVGIGTWVPVNILDVNGSAAHGTYAGKYTGPSNSLIISGNIGVGTYYPNASLIVGSGNVGIGSAFPGQALDVTGTVRMTGLTLTGNGAANGYVMVANSVGVGTWMAASTLPGTGATNYWLNDTGNVGINTSYNIGVGTISQINSMNVLGNVGLAKTSGSAYLTTTAPTGGMIVEGNVGIGTYVPNASLIVGSGNVGIGSAFPGQALDVTGTVRMTGLTLTGNGAANGYVLVSNSVGIGTWMPAGSLTSGGGTNYWLNNTGNVGINTSYNIGV